ncbi:hypothetical protein K440DRAFT_610598 [Wilcoxina mikolae CBS 423.85]|nr:hypothetical protein K440DRAFT_610598 [Wilcoxina mikolae CBS 423.85]
MTVTPPTIPPIHAPLCRVSYDVIAVEYPNQPILGHPLVRPPDQPPQRRTNRGCVERVVSMNPALLRSDTSLRPGGQAPGFETRVCG